MRKVLGKDNNIFQRMERKDREQQLLERYIDAGISHLPTHKTMSNK